jgi:hypothetical protein
MNFKHSMYHSQVIAIKENIGTTDEFYKGMFGSL